MKAVERYQGPSCGAFQAIDKSAPVKPMKIADVMYRYDIILEMACKSVKDTIGPDGLVPTFIVYGAMHLHGFAAESPNPTNLERAKASRRLTEQLEMLST